MRPPLVAVGFAHLASPIRPASARLPSRWVRPATRNRSCSQTNGPHAEFEPGSFRVVVACPDARPPAHQAALGLDKRGRLDCFLTAFHHAPSGSGRWLRRLEAIQPRRAQAWAAKLRRRAFEGLPEERIVAHPWVDLCLALENRFERGAVRAWVARRRIEGFDRRVAATLEDRRPEVALLFSDVGSVHGWRTCRARGIVGVLSMVHGEVEEERAVLAREAQRDPDWLPIYLGDAPLDGGELDELHARRRLDLAGCDWVLVPSEHIAQRLRAGGFPAERLRVIPYAADTTRFRPDFSAAAARRERDRDRPLEQTEVRFLFAGGLQQRKGLKDLLVAWRWIKTRRPGWRLTLVGEPPRKIGPWTEALRDETIDVVGRVGHDAMPNQMARADVFVFPSLFEGSAVVTYEAMACGLPVIVTPQAGSIARHGHEGWEVPARRPEILAEAMLKLGDDPELRACWGRAARQRAEMFDWNRHQQSLAEALEQARVAGPRHASPQG